MSNRCIIVGASHAAAQLIPSLRQEGWSGEILLIGDEPHLPYHRPPLSKALLAGEKSIDDLAIRPDAFYEKHQVEFCNGRVSQIDRQGRSVTLEDGRYFSYEKLALCTGSRVRKLEVPGSDLKGIHYLRSIDDVQGIQSELGPGKTAVIIGGGYIGLETAASLNKLGVQVVVLEMGDRVLQRVTAPEVSEFYTRIHTEAGVSIFTDKIVSGFSGKDCVERVICRDGSEFEADFVVVGIGILPNIELAEEAGLEVDDGIRVDECCRTSDALIVAAGDCTNHFNPLFNRRMRLESVPNANEQAKSAGAAVCGHEKTYNALPWFWSDQYDLKLQIAGLNQGYDRLIIRGNCTKDRSFAAFYFKDDRLIAADCVNRPQEFMFSKRAIVSDKTFDADTLADESVNLKDLL